MKYLLQNTDDILGFSFMDQRYLGGRCNLSQTSFAPVKTVVSTPPPSLGSGTPKIGTHILYNGGALLVYHNIILYYYTIILFAWVAITMPYNNQNYFSCASLFFDSLD